VDCHSAGAILLLSNFRNIQIKEISNHLETSTIYLLCVCAACYKGLHFCYDQTQNLSGLSAGLVILLVKFAL
jgi:hypothetical protein